MEISNILLVTFFFRLLLFNSSRRVLKLNTWQQKTQQIQFSGPVIHITNKNLQIGYFIDWHKVHCVPKLESKV